jgi:hypothetical protein
MLKAHEWEAATKLVENILLIDPDCRDAWFMKALLHFRDPTYNSFIDKAESNGMKSHDIFSKEDIGKCWGEINIYFSVVTKYGRNLSEALITMDNTETIFTDICGKLLFFGVNPGKHEISAHLTSSGTKAGRVDRTESLSFIANRDCSFEIQLTGPFESKVKIIQLD